MKAKEHQEAWAKFLGVEVEIENSIRMKLRVIPPGTYVDGNQSMEAQKLKTTAETKTVDLHNCFLLSTCEVSQKQYQKVMGSASGDSKSAAYPVVNVTWDDAHEFCQRLSNKAEEKQISNGNSRHSRVTRTLKEVLLRLTI